MASTSSSSVFAMAARLLGGKRTVHTPETDREAHRLIAHGLPSSATINLIGHLKHLRADDVLGVLGISERSFARRKTSLKAALSVQESGRLWRFAELLAHATRVFGSQEAAERWFKQPAVILGGERPLDLLTTPPGSRLVSDSLIRMEHGVYT